MMFLCDDIYKTILNYFILDPDSSLPVLELHAHMYNFKNSELQCMMIRNS